jgi:hypothetical protein
MRRRLIRFAGLLLIVAAASAIPPVRIPEPKTPFAPFEYVCRRAAGPVEIDGRLDETAWAEAEWTEVFGDIEGESKPAPRFRTRPRCFGTTPIFTSAPTSRSLTSGPR